MSQKDQTKDLANLVGANLLDHFLDSFQKQLELITDPLTQPDLRSKAKKDIYKELIKLRKPIAILSDSNAAVGVLLISIDELMKQLDEPFEVVEYTNFLITELDTAINFAIARSFGLKQKIQNTSLMETMQHVNILKTKMLIPEKYHKILQRIEEEYENGED